MTGCGFIVGILGDKFGPRLVCGIGQILAGIFITLAGLLGTSIMNIILFYSLAGICASACDGSLVPKVITAWFAPNWRGKAMLPNTLGATVWTAVLGSGYSVEIQ